MKMLVAIPVMGQYEIGRISLYCFDQLVSPDTDFLLIDNSGLDSPWLRWMDTVPAGGRWWYQNPGGNLGLIRSCQRAYEFALERGDDILCLTHNDVWIYRDRWDWDVKECFSHYDKLGGIGLFGSKGCDKGGVRLNTFGSLIEMSGHGRKMTNDREPAVTFDGFFMAFSMQMLREAGGFDQRYQWHHMYDLDASLTSIKLGYKNIVINLPCHHLSGLTANNDAKLTSGPDVHAANSRLFLEKWSHELGVTVDEEFNYTWHR